MKYDDLTLMQFVDGELEESLAAEIEKALLNDKELQSRLEVYKTTREALISVYAKEEIPAHINDLIDNFVPEKKQNRLTRLVKKNPFQTSIFSAILASIITFQGTILTTTTATQLAQGDNIDPNNTFLLNVNNDSTEVFKAAKSESPAALIEAEVMTDDQAKRLAEFLAKVEAEKPKAAAASVNAYAKSSFKCDSGYIKIGNRCIVKSSYLEEIDRQISKALSNNPEINEVIIQLGDESIILKILSD